MACDSGVAVVATASGQVRATYSGRMLGRIARDRSCAATAGDTVALRWWPDGKATIEDVSRAVARTADVIELRRH